MSIFVVWTWRGNIGYHDCTTVATETVFEKTSKFGVSKRDIVLLSFRIVLVQHIDAVTQGQ